MLHESLAIETLILLRSIAEPGKTKAAKAEVERNGYKVWEPKRSAEMDDRERGLAFLFAITLPPVMVWFLVAKFTYGIDPSTAKYLIPYLVKNTFSLWPLWSALIAGWFIGVGGLIAFIIYDKSRV